MTILTSYLLGDLIALVLFLTVLVYAYFKWSYQYWNRKNVPYLEPSIPFGNFPSPINNTASTGDITMDLYNQAKKKGWKYCGIYIVSLPTFFVMDLDLVKNIMTKDFQHFVDRGTYTNEKDNPISCHLFALGGARWKHLRAKLSPTFTSGKMKMMFQTMVDCGLILEKYMKDSVADREVVDIKEILGRFSTDIIGSCAFGLDCNTFEQPNSPFRVYGKRALSPGTIEEVQMFFSLNFPNAARALGVRVFKKDIEDFYMKVVKDTISYREKNNVSRNDFLQLLMEMRSKEDGGTGPGDGNSLTINEIVAQSFVFFIAGFETSSTTMTFALFELARHPQIQDKVREEIETVLAKHDNKITYDSMNELVYMKQVIDETLRVYPPISLLTRECIEDYKVPGSDFVMEKGTLVLIPVIGFHSDEDYYENPQQFNPDRFSAENKKSIPQYAHLPFGEGPRICIGERFGILQTKVGLTTVLKNFKISLNEEKTKLPLKMEPRSLVTSAVGGIWLNVEKI